jgi:hypothetical protein
MCGGGYATDANTRLLTGVLGNSLQSNSAQRRREFGKLVMDMFVNDSNYRQCASEKMAYATSLWVLHSGLARVLLGRVLGQQLIGRPFSVM